MIPSMVSNRVVLAGSSSTSSAASPSSLGPFGFMAARSTSSPAGQHSTAGVDSAVSSPNVRKETRGFQAFAFVPMAASSCTAAASTSGSSSSTTSSTFGPASSGNKTTSDMACSTIEEDQCGTINNFVSTCGTIGSPLLETRTADVLNINRATAADFSAMVVNGSKDDENDRAQRGTGEQAQTVNRSKDDQQSDAPLIFYASPTPVSAAPAPFFFDGCEMSLGASRCSSNQNMIQADRFHHEDRDLSAKRTSMMYSAAPAPSTTSRTSPPVVQQRGRRPTAPAVATSTSTSTSIFRVPPSREEVDDGANERTRSRNLSTDRQGNMTASEFSDSDNSSSLLDISNMTAVVRSASSTRNNDRGLFLRGRSPLQSSRSSKNGSAFSLNTSEDLERRRANENSVSSGVSSTSGSSFDFNIVDRGGGGGPSTSLGFNIAPSSPTGPGAASTLFVPARSTENNDGAFSSSTATPPPARPLAGDSTFIGTDSSGRAGSDRRINLSSLNNRNVPLASIGSTSSSSATLPALNNVVGGGGDEEQDLLVHHQHQSEQSSSRRSSSSTSTPGANAMEDVAVAHEINFFRTSAATTTKELERQISGGGVEVVLGQNTSSAIGSTNGLSCNPDGSATASATRKMSNTAFRKRVDSLSAAGADSEPESFTPSISPKNNRGSSFVASTTSGLQGLLHAADNDSLRTTGATATSSVVPQPFFAFLAYPEQASSPGDDAEEVQLPEDLLFQDTSPVSGNTKTQEQEDPTASSQVNFFLSEQNQQLFTVGQQLLDRAEAAFAGNHPVDLRTESEITEYRKQLKTVMLKLRRVFRKLNDEKQGTSSLSGNNRIISDELHAVYEKQTRAMYDALQQKLRTVKVVFNNTPAVVSTAVPQAVVVGEPADDEDEEQDQKAPSEGANRKSKQEVESHGDIADRIWRSLHGEDVLDKNNGNKNYSTEVEQRRSVDVSAGSLRDETEYMRPISESPEPRSRLHQGSESADLASRNYLLFEQVGRDSAAEAVAVSATEEDRERISDGVDKSAILQTTEFHGTAQVELEINADGTTGAIISDWKLTRDLTEGTQTALVFDKQALGRPRSGTAGGGEDSVLSRSMMENAMNRTESTRSNNSASKRSRGQKRWTAKDLEDNFEDFSRDNITLSTTSLPNRNTTSHDNAVDDSPASRRGQQDRSFKRQLSALNNSPKVKVLVGKNTNYNDGNHDSTATTIPPPNIISSERQKNYLKLMDLRVELEETRENVKDRYDSVKQFATQSPPHSPERMKAANELQELRDSDLKLKLEITKVDNKLKEAENVLDDNELSKLKKQVIERNGGNLGKQLHPFSGGGTTSAGRSSSGGAIVSSYKNFSNSVRPTRASELRHKANKGKVDHRGDKSSSGAGDATSSNTATARDEQVEKLAAGAAHQQSNKQPKQKKKTASKQADALEQDHGKILVDQIAPEKAFQKSISHPVGLLRGVYEMTENLQRMDREISLPGAEKLSLEDEREKTKQLRQKLANLTNQCATLSDELEKQAEDLEDATRQRLFLDVTKAYKKTIELHERLNTVEVRRAERFRVSKVVEEARKEALSLQENGVQLPRGLPDAVFSLEKAVQQTAAENLDLEHVEQESQEILADLRITKAKSMSSEVGDKDKKNSLSGILNNIETTSTISFGLHSDVQVVRSRYSEELEKELAGERRGGGERAGGDADAVDYFHQEQLLPEVAEQFISRTSGGVKTTSTGAAQGSTSPVVAPGAGASPTAGEVDRDQQIATSLLEAAQRQLDEQRQFALEDIAAYERKTQEEIQRREKELLKKQQLLEQQEKDQLFEQQRAKEELQNLRDAAKRDIDAKRFSLRAEEKEKVVQEKEELEKLKFELTEEQKRKEEEAEGLLASARRERTKIEDQKRELEKQKKSQDTNIEAQKATLRLQLAEQEAAARRDVESAKQKIEQARRAQEELETERKKMEAEVQLKLQQEEEKARVALAEREKLARQELESMELRIQKDAEDARKKVTELQMLTDQLAEEKKKIETAKRDKDNEILHKREELDKEELLMRKRLEEQREKARIEIEENRLQAERALLEKQEEARQEIEDARAKDRESRQAQNELERLQQQIQSQGEQLQRALEQQKLSARMEMEEREEKVRNLETKHQIEAKRQVAEFERKQLELQQQNERLQLLISGIDPTVVSGSSAQGPVVLTPSGGAQERIPDADAIKDFREALEREFPRLRGDKKLPEFSPRNLSSAFNFSDSINMTAGVDALGPAATITSAVPMQLGYPTDGQPTSIATTPAVLPMELYVPILNTTGPLVDPGARQSQNNQNLRDRPTRAFQPSLVDGGGGSASSFNQQRSNSPLNLQNNPLIRNPYGVSPASPLNRTTSPFQTPFQNPTVNSTHPLYRNNSKTSNGAGQEMNTRSAMTQPQRGADFIETRAEQLRSNLSGFGSASSPLESGGVNINEIDLFVQQQQQGASSLGGGKIADATSNTNSPGGWNFDLNGARSSATFTSQHSPMDVFDLDAKTKEKSKKLDREQALEQKYHRLQQQVDTLLLEKESATPMKINGAGAPSGVASTPPFSATDRDYADEYPFRDRKSRKSRASLGTALSQGRVDHPRSTVNYPARDITGTSELVAGAGAVVVPVATTSPSQPGQIRVSTSPSPPSTRKSKNRSSLKDQEHFTAAQRELEHHKAQLLAERQAFEEEKRRLEEEKKKLYLQPYNPGYYNNRQSTSAKYKGAALDHRVPFQDKEARKTVEKLRKDMEQMKETQRKNARAGGHKLEQLAARDRKRAYVSKVQQFNSNGNSHQLHPRDRSIDDRELQQHSSINRPARGSAATQVLEPPDQLRGSSSRGRSTAKNIKGSTPAPAPGGAATTVPNIHSRLGKPNEAFWKSAQESFAPEDSKIKELKDGKNVLVVASPPQAASRSASPAKTALPPHERLMYERRVSKASGSRSPGGSRSPSNSRPARPPGHGTDMSLKKPSNVKNGRAEWISSSSASTDDLVHDDLKSKKRRMLQQQRHRSDSPNHATASRHRERAPSPPGGGGQLNQQGSSRTRNNKVKSYSALDEPEDAVLQGTKPLEELTLRDVQRLAVQLNHWKRGAADVLSEMDMSVQARSVSPPGGGGGDLLNSNNFNRQMNQYQIRGELELSASNPLSPSSSKLTTTFEGTLRPHLGGEPNSNRAVKAFGTYVSSSAPSAAHPGLLAKDVRFMGHQLPTVQNQVRVEAVGDVRLQQVQQERRRSPLEQKLLSEREILIREIQNSLHGKTSDELVKLNESASSSMESSSSSSSTEGDHGRGYKYNYNQPHYQSRQSAAMAEQHSPTSKEPTERISGAATVRRPGYNNHRGLHPHSRTPSPPQYHGLQANKQHNFTPDSRHLYHQGSSAATPLNRGRHDDPRGHDEPGINATTNFRNSSDKDRAGQRHYSHTVASYNKSHLAARRSAAEVALPDSESDRVSGIDDRDDVDPMVVVPPYMQATESSRPKRLSYQAAKPNEFGRLPDGVKNPLIQRPRSQSPTYTVRNQPHPDKVVGLTKLTVTRRERRERVNSITEAINSRSGMIAPRPPTARGHDSLSKSTRSLSPGELMKQQQTVAGAGHAASSSPAFGSSSKSTRMPPFSPVRTRPRPFVFAESDSKGVFAGESSSTTEVDELQKGRSPILCENSQVVVERRSPTRTLGGSAAGAAHEIENREDHNRGDDKSLGPSSAAAAHKIPQSFYDDTFSCANSSTYSGGGGRSPPKKHYVSERISRLAEPKKGRGVVPPGAAGEEKKIKSNVSVVDLEEHSSKITSCSKDNDIDGDQNLVELSATSEICSNTPSRVLDDSFKTPPRSLLGERTRNGRGKGAASMSKNLHHAKSTPHLGGVVKDQWSAQSEQTKKDPKNFLRRDPARATPQVPVTSTYSYLLEKRFGKK
ncbi:unnamed protein product [Amoebophrya sp. A120]|nr:unnamed protein product [Amoebophrya sp. A120]|eukprot:GSA120T00008292001.1